MKNTKPDMCKQQHPYIIDIPKGYQYCPECELLTPHTLKEKAKPKANPYPEDWICDICGNEKYGYVLCPKCGWEHDPDRDVLPVTIKIKKHTISCIELQRKQNNEEIWWDRIEDKCNCPEVDAYTIQKIFNYKSRPVFSMDCFDAIEWSYDIMCPICNYVFEVCDGNC